MIDVQPGLQGDFAFSKDGLQVDQDGCDACHLLQETHHHGDHDWLVVGGCGQLRACDFTLCVDAALYLETDRYTYNTYTCLLYTAFISSSVV